MRTTELHNPESIGLDVIDPDEALLRLLTGQVKAVESIKVSIADIARGASLMAETVRTGGSLGYVAAGSSALVAFADGLELPGTFGIANSRIKLMIAGGVESLMDLQGNVEDKIDDGKRDIAENGLGQGDCVLAISASGTTPYTLAAHEAAKVAGATTISITNNTNTPLAEKADVAIELLTPPELISGSTRLGAATAQKVAMNLLSTMMGIRLGHVHDGYMVGVRADNKKLVDRAQRIVMAIVGCDRDEAEHCLSLTDGSVKEAALLAAGVQDLKQANELLEASSFNLRCALKEINSTAQ